jgi:prenyltransferase beta subunit
MPEVGSEDEEETEGESKLQAAKRAASMAGEQGRAHKDVDSCYSFWIGAAIKVCP